MLNITIYLSHHGYVRCGTRNEESDNDITMYVFAFWYLKETLVITSALRLIKLSDVIPHILLLCHRDIRCCLKTFFSCRYILLVFLFNKLLKFKYLEETLFLISLEINLQENACKNAKVLNYFFLIKGLIQKGLSFTFTEAG